MTAHSNPSAGDVHMLLAGGQYHASSSRVIGWFHSLFNVR
jgi:hypothetical protein